VVTLTINCDLTKAIGVDFRGWHVSLFDAF
jgi:hypothetical protein